MIYLMIYLIVGSAFFYLGIKRKTIVELSNSHLVYKTMVWPLGVILLLLALLETSFYWLSELCDTTYYKITKLLYNFEPKELPTWLDNFVTKLRG